MPRLIAIHGKKRSGKGTIAQYLINKHDFKHVVISRPLKDMMNVILEKSIDFSKGNATPFDFTDGVLKETPLKSLNGRTPRDIMIWLGTNFSYATDPDLWIKAVMPEINEHLNNGHDVFVDNIRLPPEFNMLLERGAAMWCTISTHHYDELPDKNKITFMEKTAENVINKDVIEKMIDSILEKIHSDTINNKSKQECVNILLSILIDGINGKFDATPPPSEQPLDLSQFTIIHNDGTIHELEKKAETILETMPENILTQTWGNK